MFNSDRVCFVFGMVVYPSTPGEQIGIVVSVMRVVEFVVCGCETVVMEVLALDVEDTDVVAADVNVRENVVETTILVIVETDEVESVLDVDVADGDVDVVEVADAAGETDVVVGDVDVMENVVETTVFVTVETDRVVGVADVDVADGDADVVEVADAAGVYGMQPLVRTRNVSNRSWNSPSTESLNKKHRSFDDRYVNETHSASFEHSKAHWFAELTPDG
jgi:hypothetical protein